MTEQQAKQIAFNALNKRYRVLAPAAEAVVTFPEFNPFRAAQPIARVDWPATVAMRDVTLTHFIQDGTPVLAEVK
jgi:hypothetical protein